MGKRTAAILTVVALIGLWIVASAHFIVRMSLTEFIGMCIVGVIAGTIVVSRALKDNK